MKMAMSAWNREVGRYFKIILVCQSSLQQKMKKLMKKKINEKDLVIFSGGWYEPSNYPF